MRFVHNFWPKTLDFLVIKTDNEIVNCERDFEPLDFTNASGMPLKYHTSRPSRRKRGGRTGKESLSYEQ